MGVTVARDLHRVADGVLDIAERSAVVHADVFKHVSGELALEGVLPLEAVLQADQLPVVGLASDVLHRLSDARLRLSGPAHEVVRGGVRFLV